MKVITYTDSLLAEACAALAGRIRESGFIPDLVIGIRTGGWYVAEKLLPYMPDALLTDVRAHRPKSRLKLIASGVLAILPQTVTDRLRMVESQHLAGKKPRHRFVNADLPADVLHSRRVLIVDDAVDSGLTMKLVVESVGRQLLGAQIHTAAITLTTDTPMFRPDYFLFHNQTLIRFPWSADSRK